MRTAYLLEQKLSWKTFRAIWDSFPSGGIVPKNMSRMIWGLMRDKKIYISIDPSQADDPLCISLKPPKRKYKLIKNNK